MPVIRLPHDNKDTLRQEAYHHLARAHLAGVDLANRWRHWPITLGPSLRSVIHGLRDDGLAGLPANFAK